MNYLSINKNNFPMLINDIEKIFKEYNMYGNIIEYKMDTLDPRAGIYAVVSIEPFINKINPIDIIERNERHDLLFFPKNFAIKITDNNRLNVINKITEYCSEAEFVNTIFKQYGKDVPKKIRKDELYPLIDMYTGSQNVNFSDELRRIHKNKLDKYFEIYSPDKDKDKEWVDFYRSEKYDANKSYLQNKLESIKREKNIVSLDVLFKGNSTIKKFTIAEHEFKIFKERIKNCYPDLEYSVSKMYTYDHGLLKDEKSPWGKTVTFEEYSKILEDQFAIQQYDAIKNIKPSYFENRDIYYKISDEPIIARIINDIQLKYAKCNDLEMLNRRDNTLVITIPYTNFMNFVSLAKHNHIPFHIDISGRFSKPSLETVSIVINECDKEFVMNILNRIATEKVMFSHQINNKHQSLDTKVEYAKNLSQYSKLIEEKEKVANEIVNTI